MWTDRSVADKVAEHLGAIADADALASEIAEPLGVSAPMAFAIAKESCRASDCRAYHSIWQYLRLANVVRSVRSDGPLFVAAASRRARAGRLRRVLICGTADYSMLAYLGHAARSKGAETRFDVLDRCATTLRLNAWYGARVGLAVRTIQADVFAFQPDEAYDLICTHSFLAWFEYAMRPKLVARWRDWLRPGGEVAFSNRVDTVPERPVMREHARRLQAMTAEFFDRVEEMKLDLPTDEESFRALMERYGEQALDRRRDISLDVLRGWLDEAGLALDQAAPVASVVPNAKDRASARSKEEGRPRVWFLAHRP